MNVENKEGKFPDTEPIFGALSKAFNIFHDAQALVTAANHTLERSGEDNHFLGLRVLRMGMDEIERLLKQLDVLESHLLGFNVKYEAVLGRLGAETSTAP